VYRELHGESLRNDEPTGKVAASVSEAIYAKGAAQVPPVRDMCAYLYRAILLKIAKKRQNEDRLQQAMEDKQRTAIGGSNRTVA
jgi:hypothetical protein